MNKTALMTAIGVLLSTNPLLAHAEQSDYTCSAHVELLDITQNATDRANHHTPRKVIAMASKVQKINKESLEREGTSIFKSVSLILIQKNQQTLTQESWLSIL